MMKKLIAAAGSAALFALLPGCTHTRVPSQSVSPEERAWEEIIRDNYPGYTPPPTTSRSFQGHTEERASARIRTPLKPADDPAEVKNSEAKPAEAKGDAPAADAEAKPAEAKSDAPAADAEAKPAEAKSDAPAAEAKPAEAKGDAPAAAEAKPAEAKSDAPAAEAKPAEAKSDAPAAEAKPADAKPVDAKPETAANGNPAPPDPTNSTVYEVKAGDTLGSISRKAYGDARYSNIIFKANADILKNPDKLTPGAKLIIPKL